MEKSTPMVKAPAACSAGYVSVDVIPSRFLLETPLHHTTCLIDGKLIECAGESKEVTSPVLLDDETGQPSKTILLGSYPLATEQMALEALTAAEHAYGNGMGYWPSLSSEDRIHAVEKFIQEMILQRDVIVRWLVWEIAKPYAAALKEFDRTIEFIQACTSVYGRKAFEQDIAGNYGAFDVRITLQPVGVVLCMGPFNYPLNETLTTLIPALLAGNTVVFKPPRHGVLLHTPLLSLYQNCFPKGVINVVFGSGRSTIAPIMKTGSVNGLAFIGNSASAIELKKYHPKPHQLKSVLGLEAKNAAIVLDNADIASSVKEIISGAFSYNGQRCTAIKMVYVHSSISKAFCRSLAAHADRLETGMPWTEGVEITPLAEPDKVAYLNELLDDALQQGAIVLNANGGRVCGNIFFPTLVSSVTEQMRLFNEEQFGPLLPVIIFDDVCEVISSLGKLPFGQQVSVFSNDLGNQHETISALSRLVARININSQCQRGPDELPFTGRKDSAEGTVSITDSILAFTIPVVIATKKGDAVSTTL